MADSLWHIRVMTMPTVHTPITPKLIDALYVEAMMLADEARSYFDREGQEDRAGLDPVARVGFSCESLRVTTRLMHVVSWLLVRKAIQAGELTDSDGQQPERRLGRSADSSEDMLRLAKLPPRARRIIDASQDLYNRVQRLDQQLGQPAVVESPARQLLGRLEASL